MKLCHGASATVKVVRTAAETQIYLLTYLLVLRCKCADSATFLCIFRVLNTWRISRSSVLTLIFIVQARLSATCIQIIQASTSSQISVQLAATWVVDEARLISPILTGDAGLTVGVANLPRTDLLRQASLWRAYACRRVSLGTRRRRDWHQIAIDHAAVNAGRVRAARRPVLPAPGQTQVRARCHGNPAGIAAEKFISGKRQRDRTHGASGRRLYSGLSPNSGYVLVTMTS